MVGVLVWASPIAEHLARTWEQTFYLQVILGIRNGGVEGDREGRRAQKKTMLVTTVMTGKTEETSSIKPSFS